MRHVLLLALVLSVGACTRDKAPSAAVDAGAKPEPVAVADVVELKLRFGTYTTDKPTEMYEEFKPIAAALDKTLSSKLKKATHVELVISNTYEGGIEDIVKGAVDFARFGPSSYITAKNREPDLALLAQETNEGTTSFRGLIVVPSGSPIKKIEQLKGKSVAFADEFSTSRFMAQAELARHGVLASDLKRYAYLERHDRAFEAVRLGEFDAGSLRVGTYERLNTKAELRILFAYELVTKPWIARKGLDPTISKALSEALIELKDPEVLKKLQVTGFVAASDDAYSKTRESMKYAEKFGATKSVTQR